MSFRGVFVFGFVLMVAHVGLVAAQTNPACDTKQAQCEAQCAAIGSQPDFHCDFQGGAWAASCACASPTSPSQGSPPAGSGTGTQAAAQPAPPPSPPPSPSPPSLPSPTAASCDQQRVACVQSCPAGTTATFDCKQGGSATASAAANACTCTPNTQTPPQNTLSTPASPPMVPSPPAPSVPAVGTVLTPGETKSSGLGADPTSGAVSQTILSSIVVRWMALHTLSVLGINTTI